MAFDFPTIDPAKPGFEHVRFVGNNEWKNNNAHGAVSIMLGSTSDWAKVVTCGQTLDELGIATEVIIGSAHRIPEDMAEYARHASQRGVQIVIAVAGGSAHLQAMAAAFADGVPVLGVGVLSATFGPMDVLGSNVRLPSFSPTAFMGFDKAGAINAALMAADILAINDESLRKRIRNLMNMIRESVRDDVAFEN